MRGEAAEQTKSSITHKRNFPSPLCPLLAFSSLLANF